ncbi:MAG: SDR family NAD(P)-dependent oxidoreductase, partial [Desulfobulbia bacterium]
MKTVVVFGGSGFLGIEIAKVLASHGYKTRIAVRNIENPSLKSLKKLSDKFEFIYADIRDETSVALAMKGCQSVINTVGLYLQTKSETFEAVHELGALNIGNISQKLGVKRLILISGIGTDLYSNSPYVRARAKGELLTRDVFPGATILRPSAIFGIDDKLVNS